VFIEQDVTANAAEFLEDFLCCTYHQLPSAGPESERHFVKYKAASRNGESISKRKALLRAAIKSRLNAQHHVFLVLDGYDRVGQDAQMLLDLEFAEFQAHRLRVMLTRRVPTFKVPMQRDCDFCDARGLELYWVSFTSQRQYTSTNLTSHVRHVQSLKR
jgi:hypothetical protein